MRVLCTGSTGYIGSRLVEKLLSQGVSVIGFSKSRGDNILNPRDIERALSSGVTHIYHLASKVSFNPKDAKEVYDTNYYGTCNLLSLAYKHNIEKIVYVSSAITMGVTDNPNRRINEADFAHDITDCVYAHSKLMAEIACLGSPVPTVIVNPTTVGYRVFRKVFNARLFVLCPPGGGNVIDLDDTVTGIVNAMWLGLDGSRYILSGINMTFESIYAALNLNASRKRLIIKIPRMFEKLCIRLAKRSKDPVISAYTVRNAFNYKYYTNEKARKELSWVPQKTIKKLSK